MPVTIVNSVYLRLPYKPLTSTNVHEVKTHMFRLVEQAAKGEPFVIAKAGKPLVEVIALNAPESGQATRWGLMAGQVTVPDDFDRMGSTETERLFGEER